MDLDIAYKFSLRSEESEYIIKKVFTRVVENEYVKPKQTQSFENIHRLILNHETSINKHFDNLTLILQEVQEDTNCVCWLLRHDNTRIEFQRVYSTLFNIVDRYVSPCKIKLNSMRDMSCNLPNSKTVRKLHCFSVINKAAENLYDGLYQYIKILKLALLQILSADHCNPMGFYLHEMNQMEE